MESTHALISEEQSRAIADAQNQTHTDAVLTQVMQSREYAPTVPAHCDEGSRISIPFKKLKTAAKSQSQKMGYLRLKFTNHEMETFFVKNKYVVAHPQRHSIVYVYKRDVQSKARPKDDTPVCPQSKMMQETGRQMKG
jgi:hypothetical protein